MLFTFGYKNKKYSLLRAVIAIVIGLLLLLYPNLGATRFIVLLIGLALLVFGGLMLLVLAGTMTLVGGNPASLLLAVIIFVGGILLLWNPFGERLMGVLAGLFSLVYGVNELSSLSRVGRAQKEYEVKYGRPEPKQDSGTSSKGTDFSKVKDVDYEKVDEQ